MTKLKIKYVTLLVLFLAGCFGTENESQVQLIVSSLNYTSAQPTDMLIVTGKGFDSTSTLSVRFSDSVGYKLDVPVVKVGSTSIVVAVPPYINQMSGGFTAGKVNVQVVQKTGGNTIRSSVVKNFQVQSLPSTLSKPGTITLFVLHGLIDYYNQILLDMTGTSLDIASLRTDIINNVIALKNLTTQVQTIKDDTTLKVEMGTFKGVKVVLEVQSLTETDRLFTALYQTLGRSETYVSGLLKPSSSTVAPCQQEANQALDIDQNGNFTHPYNYYTGCSSGGLPVAARKASQIIDGVAAGFMSIMALAGAPEIALALPAAALFQATTICMVTQIEVAAILKNINDTTAYRAMHEAVDQIEAKSRDLVVGQLIPNSIGLLSSIYGSMKDLSEAFSSTAGIVPIPGPACLYTYSAWSECQLNNTETRSLLFSSPSGCSGTPVLVRACVSRAVAISSADCIKQTASTWLITASGTVAGPEGTKLTVADAQAPTGSGTMNCPAWASCSRDSTNGASSSSWSYSVLATCSNCAGGPYAITATASAPADQGGMSTMDTKSGMCPQ